MNRQSQFDEYVPPEWRDRELPPERGDGRGKGRTRGDRRSRDRRRRRIRWGWIALALVVLVVGAVYLRLAVAPLQFGPAESAIRQYAAENLEEGFDFDFESASIGFRDGFRPLVRIENVVLTEQESGSEIEVGAAELVLHPLRALFGDAWVSLKAERPHVQLVQDLLGVRLAAIRFVVNDQGETTVEVAESAIRQAPLSVGTAGIQFGNAEQARLYSDNEWITQGMNSFNRGFAELSNEFAKGQLRSIEIVSARAEMIDRIYRTYREFQDVDLVIRPDGQNVHTDLTVEIAGRRTQGEIDWIPAEGGGAQITGAMHNIDLAVVMPVLDDEESYVAVKGASELSLKLSFDKDVGISHGEFVADPTGTILQIREDTFPIIADPFVVEWLPFESRFDLPPTKIRIERSDTTLEGSFVMGVDDTYGPTLSYLFRARDTTLQPLDIATPGQPIELIEVQGWGASIYGAIGIDRFSLKAGDMEMDGSGRLDFLQRGIGMDVSMSMRSATMEQLKRFWPYYIGDEIRRTLISSITDGLIDDAIFRVDLEPGFIGTDGLAGRVPDGGIFVDIRASDLKLAAFENVPGIELDGTALVRVEDNVATLRLDRAVIAHQTGDIALENIAALYSNYADPSPTLELSGDVNAQLPTLVALAKDGTFGELEGVEVSINPEDLAGEVAATIIATMRTGADGQLTAPDYAANGRVDNFASNIELDGRIIKDGQLTFTASQEGFLVNGRASMDGVVTDMALQSVDGGDPQFTASATIDAEARKAMGLDVEEFVTGEIRYVAQPQPDGTLKIGADIIDAGLTIDDLGIRKEIGEPGNFSAIIKSENGVTEVTNATLAFGDVSVAGKLTLSDEKGLTRADFSRFALSEGDNLTFALNAIDGGFAIKIDGEQFDFKPLFGENLSLDQDSTGPTADSNAPGQVLRIDANLERAIGYYRTTAYNMHVSGEIRGADIRRLDMQAQFAEGRAISITSNGTNRGNILTLASNDVGTLLRFVGIYPNLIGGEGSLVINSDTAAKRDRGEFVMSNFSIADEQALEAIVQAQADTRDEVASSNRLDFTRGKAVFARSGDQVVIESATLSGPRMGGTARGTIHTGANKRYDIVGTYIPLYGLNNAFRRLPILGRLIGGREGEGLIGVTFKVEGPLDKPEFRVNPASVLAPGAFRQLFEFRNEDPATAGE